MNKLLGHDEVVKLLLSTRDVDINISDNLGFTPLNSAAGSGHGNIVELLIESGARVNVTNNEGDTPLHSAVRGGK